MCVPSTHIQWQPHMAHTAARHVLFQNGRQDGGAERNHDVQWANYCVEGLLMLTRMLAGGKAIATAIRPGHGTSQRSSAPQAPNATAEATSLVPNAPKRQRRNEKRAAAAADVSHGEEEAKPSRNHSNEVGSSSSAAADSSAAVSVINLVLALPPALSMTSCVLPEEVCSEASVRNAFVQCLRRTTTGDLVDQVRHLPTSPHTPPSHLPTSPHVCPSLTTRLTIWLVRPAY